jgi:DNA-binding transcriptional MerR regulator
VDDLIPIGQFSALTSLSPKALRLYQDQGLLDPAHVDPTSGYRYYSRAQIGTASQIGVLRRAGIALVDIAEFLRSPGSDQVERWLVSLEKEFAEKRRMLEHISRVTNRREFTTMSDATPARLRRAIPVLASLDLEATQRFYAERLGFARLVTYPDYAISARDDLEVHFWLTDDANIPSLTSCRFDVTGIDALYEEIQAAGVVHPNAPLQEQPWGMKEFGVTDADGNLIKFGERTAADR